MRSSLAIKIFLSFWLIHAVIFGMLAVAPDPGGPRERPERPIPYGLLVTAALVSGVVCFVLARILAAPLQRMRRAARRLKEGDLSARAGAAVAGGNDEIGDVVRDFDAMAERIEFLVGAQQQLLSDISHELRSPLARLNVALELARRSSGESARGHLDRIETEAARMNELVGRLLAWARAGSAGAGSAAEPFELGELVERIAEDADYEARTAGKRVTLARRGEATIRGDAASIASALENVARNAVRYTVPGSPVEIEVSADLSAARVVVRDHGPGVPDSELAGIFLPFRRVGVARDRESGGTGLGLSIAQRAVAAHGGSIAAENAAGGGLAITISLPIRSARD